MPIRNCFYLFSVSFHFEYALDGQMNILIEEKTFVFNMVLILRLFLRIMIDSKFSTTVSYLKQKSEFQRCKITEAQW